MIAVLRVDKSCSDIWVSSVATSELASFSSNSFNALSENLMVFLLGLVAFSSLHANVVGT